MRYTLLATSKGLLGYLIGLMLKPSEAAASGQVWAKQALSQVGQQVRTATRRSVALWQHRGRPARQDGNAPPRQPANLARDSKPAGARAWSRLQS